jgi:hypothetical protein
MSVAPKRREKLALAARLDTFLNHANTQLLTFREHTGRVNPE